MDKHTEKKTETTQAAQKEFQENSTPSEQAQALEKCEKEAIEWKDKFLRATADFHNYKKRLEKDQVDSTRRVKADFLLEILNIVDNFDRALGVRQEQESSHEWIRGFEMIAKELYKFLEKHGVSEIEEVSEFNPELHEAVIQVTSDEHQPGEIVEILQKGYLLNGDVLRPAKVSVA